MTLRFAFAITAGLMIPVAARADLKLLPESVNLSGPESHQRLVLVEVTGGRATADRTAAAEFNSSAPDKVAVDKDGTVRAVGDGEAVITAKVGDRTTALTVKAAGTKAALRRSFRNEVTPVLTRNGCNSGACHGALAGKGGMKLSLRGYDLDADHFVITRQAAGRRMDGAEPAESLFLTKPTGAVKHGGGMKLTPGTPDYRVVLEWLAQGAPPHAADDPVIKDLQVFPAEATLKPGDKLGLVVRAVYSDGTTRDVTRWAKFAGTDDLVAAVDGDGKVTVAGHGETVITVVFSNLPAIVRITSPLAMPVEPKVYAESPRHNFIDELVLKKLATLQIPPSPACTDEEFIRRAFLDAAGILPTPAETLAFLADRSADKRAKLVEALQSRAEFVDYWTYKWSDLLLVSSRLPGPAMWAFNDWIRRSVADNKPWDKFARQILTAAGSTLDNGAGNYFVLHKDTTRLAEATSVTFMGTSVTCAHCHNHPMEKWTQTQYYGLANLFSRVRLKNGDRPGEVTIYEAPAGDIPHPRTGKPVPPQPLDGPAMDVDSPADRRAFFADWLTKPDNPFFARALVNRVWRNFMGRGLVESEDDLRATNPPSNEELLDALAADFVKNKYDVRALIRTIMNSAAYQRSSAKVPGGPDDDKYYGRFIVRRLSAEVLLDAYSQITAVPTKFTGMNRERQANNYTYPMGMRALQLPDTKTLSQFLDAFGRPERDQACTCERNQETTMSQALHLANGTTFNEKLRSPGSRVEMWLKEKYSDERAIEESFLLALSRRPTAAEKSRLLDVMARATADAGKDPKTAEAARRLLFEDLLWSVATGKEFLFNH